VFDSVKKLADKDKVLSPASTAALEVAMKQMAPRLQGEVHTPTQEAVSAAIEIVARYVSVETLPTTYVIGNRGVGRELLPKETTLVDSVFRLWPEYADFIRAGLVNGAEVDSREPTLTLDSLYKKTNVPTCVTQGSYIPVTFLFQSLEQFVHTDFAISTQWNQLRGASGLEPTSDSGCFQQEMLGRALSGVLQSGSKNAQPWDVQLVDIVPRFPGR
jgi:hypothetical protein